MNTLFYICTRSLRNGALTFVCTYTSVVRAQAVIDMANYGVQSRGPHDHKYVVLNAI